jgi:hypothetical protein
MPQNESADEHILSIQIELGLLFTYTTHAILWPYCKIMTFS